MTDQPSQRAMKLAQDIQDDHGPDRFVGIVEARRWATMIDAAFPAYLEIREALERGLPFIKRFAQHCEEQFGIVTVDLSGTIDKAEAALAKARKD